MKTIIFLLCMLSVALTGITQNELPKTDVNIDDVKVSPPVFAGEIIAPEEEAPKLSLLQEYMLDRITFNEELGERLKEGTEVVQFTVTPSGNVSDIKIINSVCSPIDKEVVRVLETTSGMWKPGYNNDEPVAMEKEVVLAFRPNYGLYGKSCSEYFKEKAARYFALGSKKIFLKDKPKKALHLYNDAMRYCPNDESLLFMRGLCFYKLGNIDEAQKDWERIAKLGGDISLDLIDYDLSQMEDYNEMLEIFAEINN